MAVFGSFDIVHPGHINLIKQAAALGEVHLVLARDKTIARIKGQSSYYPESDRLRQLKNIKLIKTIYLGSFNDPYSVLDEIKPEIILLGPDQKFFVNQLHEELAKRKLITIITRAQPWHIDILKSAKIRPCLTDKKNNGFLLINKPTGLSSHDVVVKLRKICGTRKIGHAGTLDPMATGLLVTGLNQATRLLSWWQLFPKSYITSLTLGLTSDTYDYFGKIKKNKILPITKNHLIETLNKFTGRLEQMPPAFSAKKIKGQPAYKLARQGQVVKLNKQTIEIYGLKLLDYTFPQVTLAVSCSSGTYIRSLVNDIGQSLQAGAIMTSLIRTKIGNITDKKATNLDELNETNWSKHLYPASELLADLNQQELNS